jgi:serine/threonine protein kinase
MRTRAIDIPAHIPESIRPPIRELFSLPEGKVVVETFVEGTDLKTLLQRKQRPWPAGEVVRLAGEIASDLHRFHLAGWVHGDVKPSNIVKREDPQRAHYTLIDLDTAAPIGRRMAPYSFVYAPPELILNLKELYGPHGDIFSLAVVVWELLTGETYLSADHPAVLLQLQISRPMPAHKKIPASVFQVLQRATAIPSFPVPPQRLPSHEVRRAFLTCLKLRYASALQFAEDLTQAVG